jgi:hypothetical protein
VYDTFGIHYCRDHYDAIRDNAKHAWNEAERIAHYSMVYIERQLFMDVTRQLYEKLRVCEATKVSLGYKLLKANKIHDTLKKVGYLMLAMIPLAFVIHLMW